MELSYLLKYEEEKHWLTLLHNTSLFSVRHFGDSRHI